MGTLNSYIFGLGLRPGDALEFSESGQILPDQGTRGTPSKPPQPNRQMWLELTSAVGTTPLQCIIIIHN